MTRLKVHQQIIDSLDVTIDDPSFPDRVFKAVSHIKSPLLAEKSEIDKIVGEDFDELSRALDLSDIQESCSVRNVLISRRLAQLLIDEKGDIRSDLLPELIEKWKKNLYFLGPKRQYDGIRREHTLKVLNLLQDNKKIGQLIKRFTRPLSHRQAENLVRDTLNLPLTTSITDAHVRQAVLSALFCYLRQNIGSCFATAPAEIIHDEQSELFLLDLLDLLSTGRLKRTFGGIEHAVPLSASWGNGDLRKPLVCKQREDRIEPEVWRSPGLIAAFDAVDVFGSDQNKEEVSKKIYHIIFDWITASDSSIITAENIIQKVLLDHFNVSEAQLNEFQTRPKEGISGDILLNIPKYSKEKSTLSQRCQAYLSQLDVAKNAFKSLADNALLKAWEFTLASLAENKLEFTKWNLYASLGLATQEPGGIGECLFQYIQHQVNIINSQLEEIQRDYEAAYSYLQMAEARLKRAASEQEAQWSRMDYQSRLNEFKSIEQRKIRDQDKSKAWAEMHDMLHKVYMYLFKDYFQEVYDADTKSEVQTRFDDSPAGFRLIYKHGRSNTSLWTWIRTPSEFIDSLCSFFTATEPYIVEEMDFKDMHREFSELITTLIQHIKTPRFLETAFDRMAAAHRMQPIKDPLENLDKIDKKPWAYTSGGTMNTLMQCYYKLEDSPKEEGRWVESEVELVIFIVDCLKQMAPNIIKPYVGNQRQAMLMQSPTHAFLLTPNQNPFKKMWTNDIFTYTYIRDNYIQPSTRFIEEMQLTDEMIQHLLFILAGKVHENYRPRFKDLFRYVHGPMNSIEFRNQLVQFLEEDRAFRFSNYARQLTDEIDSLLYATLPLFPNYDLKNRLRQLLVMLPEINSDQLDDMMDLFEKIPSSAGRYLLGSDQLQEICKALICLKKITTTSPFDWSFLISQAAQKLEFAMPVPLIFADTNWVKDQFAFLVSPGTGKLELWRVDYVGRRGSPMSMWKQWVDGTQPDIKWVIYTLPYQYNQI